MEVPANYKNI